LVSLSLTAPSTKNVSPRIFKNWFILATKIPWYKIPRPRVDEEVHADSERQSRSLHVFEMVYSRMIMILLSRTGFVKDQRHEHRFRKEVK